MKRIIIGIVAGLAMAASATASADPPAFATATGTCGEPSYAGEWEYVANFPAIANHTQPIVRITSNGATGGDFYESNVQFGPGDQIWTYTNQYNDSTSSGGGVDFGSTHNPCSGSVQVDLVDRPTTPATLSGVFANGNSASHLPITVPHAGQYVVDATLDQGAIKLSPDGWSNASSIVIPRSGTYQLGAFSTGAVDMLVQAVPGPPAHWSLTVRALPTQLSGLAFVSQWVAPGTADTASFSVSGDTTLTGYVRNAAGQVVDHIGTWTVAQGNSSVTWDARTDGGGDPPDGTYYLHLDTADGTAAEAAVRIDHTAPAITMTSPGRIGARQSASFRVADTGIGTRSISVSIDGHRRNVSMSAGRFSVSAPRWGWTHKRHKWSVTACDRLGNRRTRAGSFTIKRRG